MIVNISTNLALDGLIFYMHVPNIDVGGTVSQIFVLGLRFHFMSKNGYIFTISLIIFF